MPVFSRDGSAFKDIMKRIRLVAPTDMSVLIFGENGTGKEHIAPEYKLIRKDQLVFTFFHFASSEPLTRAMIDSGAVCCAYETVERADRSLPLLIPM